MKYAMGFALTVFMMFAGFYKYQSISYLSEINSYKSQIASLDAQSKQIEKQLENAENQAKIEMQQYKDEAEKILAENVSKNCEEAIKWGISQANRMK